SPSTMTRISDSSPERQLGPNGPTTPNAQRLPAITRARFSLIRFRSPLLTESRLLSPPAGTEMFHFPAFTPHALCVQAWVAEFYSTGFPHSDTLGSQLGCQLLEAYRRLLRPSSAPGAKTSTVCPYKLAIPTTLDTLDNNPDTRKRRGHPSQNTKMLASTIQFSSNEQTPTPHPPPTRTPYNTGSGRF